MTHKPLKITAATTVAAGLLLAGCGNSADVAEPSASTAATSAAHESSAAETTTETAKPTADTRAAAAADSQMVPGGYSADPTDTFTGTTSRLRTTDIRVGSHDGFDRVVFEYEGDGPPEFSAGYTDDVRQQTSGNPMEVPGAKALQIIVHGTSLDETPEAKYAGKQNLNLASGSIKSVVNGGSFEGVSQFFIGVDAQKPYKVTVLQNPTRLVVDVQK